MSEMLYYITDTETNGLKAGWNEVTQISVVRCSDRHQLTRHVKIDHPERTQPQALAATGRVMADILKGEDKLKVIEECEKFWEQDGKTPEHRCLVAHNSSFDKRFCHAMWGSVGKKFPVVCWMDTIKFAKEWAKKIGRAPENYQLKTVLKFAGLVPKGKLHEAGADARNTYMFWKKGMDTKVDHLSSIRRYPHALELVEDIELPFKV
jgi:DNA polymerase III epsilon subunit-like protein